MLRARLAATAVAAIAMACSGGGGGGGGTTTAAGPVATARGTPVEAGATATITATGGGTFSSSDGRLMITLPAGAFDPGTVLTIQRIANTAPGGIGNGYRLLPSRTFSSPVALQFDASGISSADAGGMGVAYQTADGHWSWIAEGLVRDVAGEKVTVTTTHFTDFSLVSSILLQPLSASVHTGASVALEVAACFEPDSNGSLASLLAWECSTALAPLGVALDASSWSVNGVPGGNATWGTITPGAGLSATYRAPSSAPDPSTVAVTVKTQAMPGRPQATLYALVTVSGLGPFHGSIAGTGTFGLIGPLTFRIDDATLTVHEFAPGVYDDGPDETNYDLTGTMTVPSSVSGSGVTCTITTTTAAIDENFKVLKSPAAVRFAVTAEFPASCSFGPATLIVTYGTYTPGCASQPLLVDVPIQDTQHLDGSYSTQCVTTTASGEWSFAP